jgi:hypothetical protein
VLDLTATSWRSYSLGPQVMTSWNRFAVMGIKGDSKLLFFGECRIREEHVFLLDLVSGEMFKSYEGDYRTKERDEFRGGGVRMVGEKVYVVGASHLHVFEEGKGFDVVKN